MEKALFPLDTNDCVVMVTDPFLRACAARAQAHSVLRDALQPRPLFSPLPLTPPLPPQVLTFFASALGAAGGIGGGGIMVPMLVSVGGFSVHHAIPLTQATVFGASVMNLVHNGNKRHPDFDRPLIDYHTALMLEVTTLLGTVLGVDLNSLSPVWMITILLILTLSFTTYRTLKKGLELQAKENAAAVSEGGVGGGQDQGDTAQGRRWEPREGGG